MENTEVVTQDTVSSDDKTLALLSHLSLVLGGILLPVIIWATQKDKSKFVRFHSLQSIFYHLSLAVIIAVVVIFVALILIIAGIGFEAFNNHHGHNSGAFAILVTIVLYGLIFVIGVGGVAYSVYAGIRAYKGEYFKFPVIGNLIYNKIYGQKP